MTEVKAKCLYVNRRWEDLDADHRRGAGRGAGKGVLSAQRGDTLPKYLNTHPHRQTAHVPKDTSLQPMGHIWLIEVLLFFVSGLFIWFLVKQLPIYKKQKILHFIYFLTRSLLEYNCFTILC